METLAYLHLALTHEDFQNGDETAFSVVRCPIESQRCRTRSSYGILVLGTVIGLFGTTTNAFALLQYGDRNPQVTRVQKRLQELEFFPEEPTGYFGEVTIDAVKQFQRDRELDADGIVGNETEAALFENQKARSNTPFNTESFLASPESQTSNPSSRPQPATSGETGTTTSPAFPPPTISSSQPEPFPASEEESLLSETLEPASAAAEPQTRPDSEESSPRAVAERVAARVQLLKVGARGESVKQLQEKLQDAGFAPGEIDGIYGKQTQRAVIAFQRSRGLFVDGIAGQQTLSTLKMGSSSAPSQRLYTVKVRNS